ncbi:MAG: hypothetical protein ABJN51_16200 [Sneathiella sp.]
MGFFGFDSVRDAFDGGGRGGSPKRFRGIRQDAMGSNGREAFEHVDLDRHLRNPELDLNNSSLPQIRSHDQMANEPSRPGSENTTLKGNSHD